ncbi:Solute carrier family 23 member 2 [Armadillidium nasatum]|uniref:Solute carrier family 23 member 2 n=1 Tax=Armadillidium nasatum TaxID=96803 RepID=A0A5N5TDB8_9CRUS|nr:Solute carrier family 23 member 2 [Armadillidium nasatum]
MKLILTKALPVIQGATFAFLLPTISILSTSFDSCQTYDYANLTNIEKDEIWMTRMRAVQGAVTVASVTEVLIGLTGKLVGYLAHWITPLTIVPTITLMGLSLFRAAAEEAATHWGISIMTAAFFVIIITITISWAICVILTVFEVFPKDSEARTDSKIPLIRSSPWFYVPYPFQWGFITVSAAGVIGMIAGVLSSIVESIGDYYACSHLTVYYMMHLIIILCLNSDISTHFKDEGKSGPLPDHALNRGIFIEGIGCVIAGIIGTGNGTTTYSTNIPALRITKVCYIFSRHVASRRVIQVAAIFMIICGVCTKFSSIFISIPNPVVGGIFLIMFGIIASVGLSNLQVIDLNSSRNIFILGVSLFIGLAIPEWLQNNPGSIQTGSPVADQVLLVLLKTSMFVGGVMGLFLDNTVPVKVLVLVIIISGRV